MHASNKTMREYMPSIYECINTCRNKYMQYMNKRMEVIPSSDNKMRMLPGIILNGGNDSAHRICASIVPAKYNFLTNLVLFV